MSSDSPTPSAITTRRPAALTPVPLERFVDAWSALLRALPDGLVRDAKIVRLDSCRPPWTATELQLRRGDEVSWFACGETVLTALPSIRVSPTLQVWARVVGQAPIFRGVRDSHSFVAAHDGPLELATYFPGEWSDRAGALAVPPEAYAGAEGEIAVVVLHWANGVRAYDGLARLPAAGLVAPAIADELDRLERAVTPPPGWSYLWAPGPAEIYHPTPDHCIACHTRADVGIVQYDVDCPLEPGTLVEWDWRIARLPSAVGEDTLPTHDYMSLAIEFDDGRDLSWFWSAELPPETYFACPIPTWTARETHLVIRSGSDEIGTWQRERRDAHADCLRCIGAPPARIVRVWLIAVSLFQRGEGLCAYRDITLVDAAGRRTRIG